LPVMIVSWRKHTNSKVKNKEPGPPSSITVWDNKDPAEPADAHKTKDLPIG
jgi:hypothetical protein